MLQAQPDIKVDAGAQATASGGASASASAEASASVSGPPPYIFLGVHPTAFDKQGRMTRIEQWPVLCGPPPPDPKPGAAPSEDAYMTRRPFPGLRIEGQVCIPEGKAAVLGAARASRGLSPVQSSHWVREEAR